MLSGLAFGVFSCVWTRSWDATTRATGWPFPIAVFKLEGDHGVDYIGQGWQLPADFLVGLLLGLAPFVAFRLHSRLRRTPPSP